jgi:hypothetical protein
LVSHLHSASCKSVNSESKALGKERHFLRRLNATVSVPGNR